MWLQFEERTVRKVQSAELEQELKRKRPGETLLIYDDDRYMGYLGWEKEEWNRPENIVTEYVACKTYAGALCENVLMMKPVIKVPVFMENKEADKVVFAGKAAGLTDYENELLIAIQSLKKTKSLRFTRRLSKYKGVLLPNPGFIFDQLEELLKEYDINVLRKYSEVVDAGWLILDENEDEYEIIAQSILREADFESLQTYLKVKRQLEEKGIPVITPKILLSKYRDKGIYITTTRYAEEIFEELMDGGIAYSNIFFNPHPGYTIE